MGSDGIFPDWSADFSSPSYIQLVGAYSGECSDILRDSCVYLRDNDYNNVQAIPMQSSQDITNIEQALGSVFIFFDPEYSSKSSIEELNHHVISAASYWIENNAEMVENTAFIFQGESEVLSNKVDRLLQISPSTRSKIFVEIIDKGDIDQLKNTVLTKCMCFEWSNEYE